MVSVYQVYQSLKDVANKEQKGFITPQVFNNFASLAQLNIYNEMFSELVDAKRISRQNLDPGRDKSIRKQKLEDLSFYIKCEDNFGHVTPNFYVVDMCLLCVWYVCCCVFAMLLLCVLLCFCYMFTMYLLCFCYVFAMFLLWFCYVFVLCLLYSCYYFAV